MKVFGSGGSDERRASGPVLSLGRGDRSGLWLRARATSCFSSLAARRCHAKPPVTKLVGCSLVTRSSRLGARSSCNFDLQIDFPLKRSEAFPVLLQGSC